MPIIDILTVELGSSIAKAILKIWLKDKGIAADVTSDLLGLIKGKTQDVIAQQRAKRQFEAIGEKVAENLLPLFQAEDSHFIEERQIAVALRIADILRTSTIDAALLAEGDLKPSKLLTYLQQLHSSRTNDFSEVESEFLERILSEVCQNIVDIASELPAFTEKTLSEILKRETELIMKADMILEEVRNIRQSSQGSGNTPQSSFFEKEYRRAIARNLDEVELFGTDVSRASRRHRISVSYVVLEARKTISQSTHETAELNVHRVINDCARILLKGDPGSGKTTLLKWIAVQAASGKFPADLGEFNTYIPFFIKLRNFTDRALPSPQDFPDLVAPAIVGLMPSTWVHDKLESGKAFVLIDGLDELPQTKQDDVRRWLTDLIGTFPNSRYILSSRPSIINDQWDSFAGFEGAFLQPMTDWAIDIFIDKWHVAVQELIDEPLDKQELPSLALNLKRVIRDNKRIFALAKTPLLCALICALHRDRRQQLPKDRIELYSACTQMLVERREKERGLDYKGQYPQLSYRQKIALLKDCAYWFMRNDWGSVEVPRFDQHISSKLQNMENIDRNISGENIRRYFVERSGILREPSKGIIDFTHKTFQEFLAAQQILDEDDIDFLINKAVDNQWSEVIVLAIGLASPKVGDQILNTLIRLGNAERKAEKKYRYYLLVASCLETVVSLSPAIKVDIEKSLSQLIPPKDRSEAQKWASAGDIAIPYLLEHALKREKNAEECIRSLTMISSKSAMQALGSIAPSSRDNILKILADGWDYFDREEYAKDVLSKNEEVGKHIAYVPDTQGLSYLPYLTRLRIKNGLLTRLDGVDDLKLEYIGLLRCPSVVDIESLSQMKSLRALVLAGCLAIKDIEPLRKLVNLQLLDLSLCKQIEDLSPIVDMKNLKILSLAGCSKIQNLSPLLLSTELLAVNLSDCEKIAFTQIEQIRNERKNVLIYNVSPDIIKSAEISRDNSISDSRRLGASRDGYSYRSEHYLPTPPPAPTLSPQMSSKTPTLAYYMNQFTVKCGQIIANMDSARDLLRYVTEYSQDLKSAFEFYRAGYSEDYQISKPGFTSGDTFYLAT